ncbi:hypothetical protein [Nereida sp. MMG025]|uniref:hypothetical protein n=1 Tax=Nereida sp. MMG025 TaxID=2909981 RepID=UPI001F462A56|nr:hypothetical protein [Nereida sp. MMG025]MCF6443465.1 hypothetical protein [Nereida sp. MMG025]
MKNLILSALLTASLTLPSLGLADAYLDRLDGEIGSMACFDDVGIVKNTTSNFKREDRARSASEKNLHARIYNMMRTKMGWSETENPISLEMLQRTGNLTTNCTRNVWRLRTLGRTYTCTTQARVCFINVDTTRDSCNARDARKHRYRKDYFTGIAGFPEGKDSCDQKVGDTWIANGAPCPTNYFPVYRKGKHDFCLPRAILGVVEDAYGGDKSF